MNMEDILNSGANVTLTIKSTDLKEASQILHTDKSTLWRWHKIGYLCRLEIGGKRLYRKSDVDAILQKENN